MPTGKELNQTDITKPHPYTNIMKDIEEKNESKITIEFNQIFPQRHHRKNWPNQS